MKKNMLILVRGGGDLATGTIHRLWAAGFPVVVLEIAHPAAIRRQVSVCEAVYDGKVTVEGMTAVKVENIDDIGEVLSRREVPVLVDETGDSIQKLAPPIVVDAILAKRNLGTTRTMAPLTIALGPGFTAGVDVDYIIETKRGHDLGRIISKGTAVPNTGIPGNIGGYAAERVIHAAEAGIFHNRSRIGDIVQAGRVIAEIETPDGQAIPVTATITGILRGLLREGYPVTRGFKIADIDPRQEELKNCFTISDKSRCIAGSVLELCTAFVFSEK